MMPCAIESESSSKRIRIVKWLFGYSVSWLHVSSFGIRDYTLVWTGSDDAGVEGSGHASVKPCQPTKQASYAQIGSDTFW
jgi:hypothetical protein